MAYFPLSERAHTLALTCSHILEGESDIRYVLHHFDDGSWEFLCGEDGHTDAEAVVITIGELLELDPSLQRISDLPVGCCAHRASKATPWETARIDGENWYAQAADRML